MFLSAVHDRLLPTGLSDLHTPLPAPIRTATRNYRQAIEDLTHKKVSQHDRRTIKRTSKT